MKKVIRQLYIFTACVFCMGCKEFLDVKNNNTVVIASELEHLEAMLADPVRMNFDNTPSILETFADDYFMLPSRFEITDEAWRGPYIWKMDEYRHNNDWSSGYEAIFNANFSIELLNKWGRTSENSEQYDSILGQALFFRAYNYNHLLWAFAPAFDEASADVDKGIVLKVDTDFNTPSVRSSVRECYERTITEAITALPLLPDHPEILTQPSKAAAHGLLARTYLSMRKYEQALYHAKEVLNIKSELMDYNNPADGVFLGRNYTFDKYTKETIFHTEMITNRNAFFIGSRGGRVDTVLIGMYHENDLRREAFLKENAGYHEFKGSYANYLNFSGLTTAEMYLVAAECSARLGSLTDANYYLNTLLRNRYRTGTYVDIELQIHNAVDVLLAERRKELLLRGLRLMDIKRFNKEGRNINLQRNINGDVYDWAFEDSGFIVPIPIDLEGFVK